MSIRPVPRTDALTVPRVHPAPHGRVHGAAQDTTIHESLTDAIGETPLIRLTRLTEGIAAPVYVKAEFLNPGGSVKDRAARQMVLAAEQDGSLRPGGVIVEGTSGNTGIGLAMVAAQRGYRAVLVLPDKTSAEKIALLRAYGAQVVVTASALPREHPDHVSQVARRIAETTPGGWFANQYDNPANPRAHFETTGPEIWRQTGGRVTHFVAGIGTGGTVTGTGRYLKQASGGTVRIVGVDPEQSTYAGGDGSPYYVESIGHYLHPDTVEDLWPQSYEPGALDEFERVGDRESLLTVRRAAREEGLLVGGSSGTALAAALRVARRLGPDDLVVALLPDSGRSYLSKYFDDGWLLRYGFLDADEPDGAVGGLLRGAPPRAVSAAASARAALESLGSAAPDDEVVLAVLPRETDAPTRSLGDVAGLIPVGRLRRLAGDEATAADPLSRHLPHPPFTLGAGESAAEARSRLPEGTEHVAVLLDGRVIGVLTHGQL
jgi:cystathionine beta-synthase